MKQNGQFIHYFFDKSEHSIDKCHWNYPEESCWIDQYRMNSSQSSLHVRSREIQFCHERCHVMELSASHISFGFHLLQIESLPVCALFWLNACIWICSFHSERNTSSLISRWLSTVKLPTKISITNQEHNTGASSVTVQQGTAQYNMAHCVTRQQQSWNMVNFE